MKKEKKKRRMRKRQKKALVMSVELEEKQEEGCCRGWRCQRRNRGEERRDEKENFKVGPDGERGGSKKKVLKG